MRTNITSTAKRLITFVTVVGALSAAVVGLAGVTGAATTTGTVSPAAQARRNAVCASVRKHHPKRSGAGFAKEAGGFAKRAQALETKAATAKAHGHQNYAVSLQKYAAWLDKLGGIYRSNASRQAKQYAKAQARLSAEVARYCSSS